MTMKVRIVLSWLRNHPLEKREKEDMHLVI